MRGPRAGELGRRGCVLGEAVGSFGQFFSQRTGKTLCETLAIFAPLREIGAVQFARIVSRGREPNLSQRRKDRQDLAKLKLNAWVGKRIETLPGHLSKRSPPARREPSSPKPSNRTGDTLEQCSPLR